jgi:hypothetical protein
MINKLNHSFQNAFSIRLSPFAFHFFSMFHVDLMHEVELGVWRSLFIHLLRILECIVGATDELNKRLVGLLSLSTHWQLIFF